MDSDTRRALEAHKREIVALAAETIALQTLFILFANRVGTISPELAKAVFQAFDEAANFAEHFSITRGRASAHMTKTLKIIEQMRAAVAGKSKPEHGV